MLKPQLNYTRQRGFTTVLRCELHGAKIKRNQILGVKTNISEH